MSDLVDLDPFVPARRPSPGRAQRRRLAVDFTLAVVLAIVFVSVAGGLGVVAWFGVPILLIGLLSVAVDRVVIRRRRQRQDSA